MKELKHRRRVAANLFDQRRAKKTKTKKKKKKKKKVRNCWGRRIRKNEKADWIVIGTTPMTSSTTSDASLFHIDYLFSFYWWRGTRPAMPIGCQLGKSPFIRTSPPLRLHPPHPPHPPSSFHIEISSPLLYFDLTFIFMPAILKHLQHLNDLNDVGECHHIHHLFFVLKWTQASDWLPSHFIRWEKLGEPSSILKNPTTSTTSFPVANTNDFKRWSMIAPTQMNNEMRPGPWNFHTVEMTWLKSYSNSVQFIKCKWMQMYNKSTDCYANTKEMLHSGRLHSRWIFSPMT